MKNFLLTLTLSAAMLCSCSSGGSAKPCDVDEKFSSDVKITQDDKEYNVKLSRADADIWELAFSEPETVKGLKLGFTGNVCTLELEGLKYELDRKDVSQYSMASLCCGAMEQLINKRELTCSEQDGVLTEKGSINGHDFSAVFEDGKIKELTVSGQLRCEF